MAIFMSPALLMEAVGEAERFAGLRGATAGECQLLLHVAIHRLLRGGTAADVAESSSRAVADPELVAAIGPESAWQDFVIGGLCKADRLDAARRTVAVAFKEARRRGSAPVSPRPRCGGRGSTCVPGRPPARRRTPGPPTSSCPSGCGSTSGARRASCRC